MPTQIAHELCDPTNDKHVFLVDDLGEPLPGRARCLCARFSSTEALETAERVVLQRLYPGQV